MLCSVEECLCRRRASDEEFRERTSGFKAAQGSAAQENCSASKGHDAAEPPPGLSLPHAPGAPPAKQLHAPGSSALSQSGHLVSTSEA